jgi:hypothetical protein
VSLRTLLDIHQFLWSMEANAQQRLVWQDAAEARIAREKSERAAAEQLKAMMDANPSGQLGHSRLDDEDRLKEAGLL